MAKTRKDPPQRPMTGLSSWTDLRNPDPNKRYVWVNQLLTEQGPDMYEASGYEYERFDSNPGGLRLMQQGKMTDSEPIVRAGHVLMSIELEKHEENEQYGTMGSQGQQSIERIEAYMNGPAAVRALNKGAAEAHMSVTADPKHRGEYVNG